MKQVAQTIVRDVEGVEVINNRLVVVGWASDWCALSGRALEHIGKHPHPGSSIGVK